MGLPRLHRCPLVMVSYLALRGRASLRCEGGCLKMKEATDDSGDHDDGDDDAGLLVRLRCDDVLLWYLRCFRFLLFALSGEPGRAHSAHCVSTRHGNGQGLLTTNSTCAFSAHQNTFHHQAARVHEASSLELFWTVPHMHVYVTRRLRRGHGDSSLSACGIHIDKAYSRRLMK